MTNRSIRKRPYLFPATVPSYVDDEIRYREQIDKYKNFEKKNKFWKPDRDVLSYAVKNNKLEDLKYLQSKRKLNGKLKELLKAALVHGHENLLKDFILLESKTKRCISIFDWIDWTGDIGELVDLLRRNGDIMNLCEWNNTESISRMRYYAEITRSNRLYRCLEERGILTVGEGSTDLNQAIISMNEKGETSTQHAVVLYFEKLDSSELILTKREGKFLHELPIDAKSEERICVVSPSTNESSIHRTFALAALHFVHAAQGIKGLCRLTFTHVHTSDLIADKSLPSKFFSGQMNSTLRCDSEVTCSAGNIALTKETYELQYNPYDCNSLHDIILHKRSDELRKILHNRESLDVNAKDDAGWTPLNLAVLLEDRKMVEMLLKNGASTTLDQVQDLPAFIRWDGKFNTTLSPLMLSVRLNLSDIVQLLTENDPDVPTMGLSIDIAYGMKVESALLEAVCRKAEIKYRDIGVRFKPTYKVNKNEQIQRVCLGFSDYVNDIEQKESLYGVDIVIMNIDMCSENDWREHDNVIPEDQENISKSVIDTWAENLWKQHPNLNAITAGMLFRENGSEDPYPLCHIILHCSHKGYAPHGSKWFPTELSCEMGKMPVAVVEGQFRLSPLCNPSGDTSQTPVPPSTNIQENSTYKYKMTKKDHLPLKIGMHLCKWHDTDPQNVHRGTLGVFVDIDNVKTGFITCAHVLYRDEVLRGAGSIHFPGLPGTNVIAPYNHFYNQFEEEDDRMDTGDDSNDDTDRCSKAYWECGRLVRAVFDPTLNTGIDAALIEIDPARVPRDGSFDEINDIHLINAGMDVRKRPVFASAKVANVEYLQPMVSEGKAIQCMKLGASSGLTVGKLTYKNGQVRVDSDSLGIEEDSTYKHILKNQYVISELRSKQFFENGDSGSGVFVIKEGDDQPDACLGIAIGFVDKGMKKTFVTPITNILDTLKSGYASELNLKKFE